MKQETGDGNRRPTPDWDRAYRVLAHGDVAVADRREDGGEKAVKARRQ
jgi:hypothetical protein